MKKTQQLPGSLAGFKKSAILSTLKRLCDAFDLKLSDLILDDIPLDHEEELSESKRMLMRYVRAISDENADRILNVIQKLAQTQ